MIISETNNNKQYLYEAVEGAWCCIVLVPSNVCSTVSRISIFPQQILFTHHY